MTRVYDIAGQKFGSLTAIKRVDAKDGRSIWLFRCDCGGECVTMAQTAKAGDLKHCPQCRQDRRSERQTVHGDSSHRRGRRERLWVTWNAMRARCNSPSIPNYARYGARGIKVCPEWDDYSTFRSWALANGYRDDLTIDRIDVDGNYEPSNCRWITRSEQAQNKRQTRWYEFRGERMNLMQIAKLTGVGWHTLRGRLNAGLSIDEAVAWKKRAYLPTRRNYKRVSEHEVR